MAGTAFELDTAASVLSFARERRTVAERAEADLLQAAVAWAAMHSVDSIDQAATFSDGRYGDTAMTVAGPGAPLVAEFSVAEFAAAIGLPTEAGKTYLGEAVELRHRLPRVWARVTAGDLAAWRARRIARATLLLSVEAAAFVDRHVAHVAHKIRVGQLDRLIEEAIARFMPAEAERRRRDAAEGRGFNVDKRQASLEGTLDVWGTLDLADALDLDQAVTAAAQALKDLGSTDSLDVRRAIALGQIARQQLALDLDTDDGGEDDGEDGEPARPGSRSRKPARQVVLYVHLSQAAVADRHLDGAGHLGRVENTKSPVTAEQVRDWCANPDAQVVVKPVIDLEDHVHVDSYEVHDRLAETTALIDHSCVFPWCTRPARATTPEEHDADCDHITPYRPDGTGGDSCTCNIAPLCRRHHRLKTHGRWTYTPLDRGTYLWTSPHGHQYLRDHHGTLDVSHDTRTRPPPRP